MSDSFGTHGELAVGGRRYRIARLAALEAHGLPISRLPYALKVLLENLLRREDGAVVTAADVEALARWQPAAEPDREIAFMPARVLLQDFTGVPAVVDLAAMRDAMARAGRRPQEDQPAAAGRAGDRPLGAGGRVRPGGGLPDQRRAGVRAQPRALRLPALGPAGLRRLQGGAAGHRHRPPGQPRIPGAGGDDRRGRRRRGGNGGAPWAYPDTLVGTDSHTTMINGLGVLGWGVGGIEAEAAMLGQPVSMLIPQVVGFRLTGELPEGATATDLVLTVTEMLRKQGGGGEVRRVLRTGPAGACALADRATIANMAPEYGATCGIFPVDEVALGYLRFTGRSPERIALVEAYMKEQGLFHGAGSAGGRVHRHPGARPRHRRGLAGRPPPAAGPGAPVRRQAELPRRPRRDAEAGGDGGEAGRRPAGAQDPGPLGGRGGRRRDGGGGRGAREAGGRRRGERRERRLHARPRRGRHRRHHQLHQHLEPVGDGGGRTAGEEGGGARPRPSSRG